MQFVKKACSLLTYTYIQKFVDTFTVFVEKSRLLILYIIYFTNIKHPTRRLIYRIWRVHAFVRTMNSVSAYNIYIYLGVEKLWLCRLTKI